MINTAATYRRDDRSTPRVPVVMPRAGVTVDINGYLTVTLDHEPYCADGTLRRDDLKRVLDDIASDLDTPVRVEVREADNSTFTDIVTPVPRASGPTPVVRKAFASAFGISGEGFTAGEQVEVCIVIARQIADDDGATHLRLPPALLADHPNVILVARASGTVACGEGAT